MGTHEDHTAIFEEGTRLERAPDIPNEDYLRNMYVVVHLRQKYLKDSIGRDRMDGMMIGIDNELRVHNIYFQSIMPRDVDSIQIMCGDAEERDHIKHLLLKYDHVLAVDIEGNRFFTKFAEEFETEEFKYLKSLDEEKKARLQQMIKDNEAAMEAENAK